MKSVLSLGIISAAFAGLMAATASAAPITPPTARAETSNQAEQVRDRRLSGRHYRHRHHRGHHYGRSYGPRYYGYRHYDNYYYGGGPYVYGGVGLPFIGLSFGGGHRHHHRHW